MIASLRTNPAESNRIGLDLNLVANLQNNSELASKYGVNVSESVINENISYKFQMIWQLFMKKCISLKTQ